MKEEIWNKTLKNTKFNPPAIFVWVKDGQEVRRKRGTDLEKELFIKFSNEVFGIKDPKYAIQSVLT